jgi:Ca-activated chloride channel family protein
MRASLVIPRVIILYLFIFNVRAQVQFSKTEYDFGDIEANQPRFVDIFLTNKTSKDAYVLRVDQPNEVVYRQQKAIMLPDSSTTLRFQINNKKTGRFNYQVNVFTSDKLTPTVIHLKGRINSLPSDIQNLTACPTFDQRPATQNPNSFTLTVKTIDSATGKDLSNSTVAILQNGQALGKWKTTNNGQFKIKIPLGISYFYATHKDYLPFEKGAYINFKRNLIVLPLSPQVTITSYDEKEIITTIPHENKDTIFVADLNEQNVDLNELIKDERIQDTIANDTLPLLSEIDEENFSEEYFKPINIVFVIDVSSSMRQEDRIELMKYALNELTDMLRPQDKIGLVSYATEAQVLLPPTSGSNKSEINEIVKDIRALGSTAGGAGIKLGYRQSRRNFIKGGANQVIIITDGAFNRKSGDYKKFIKKNLKKCVTLSVVGIKTNKSAEETMREAAALGKGRYIDISRLADAQTKLKQEVRLSSFRR